MSMKVSTWAEVIGIVALIVSLIFVGIEIRQNTATSAAQALLELNVAINEQQNLRIENINLNKLVIKGGSDYQSLTADEKLLYRSWTAGIWNLYEAALTFYRNGVIDEAEYSAWNVSNLCPLNSGALDFWRINEQLFTSYFRKAINACQSSNLDNS